MKTAWEIISEVIRNSESMPPPRLIVSNEPLRNTMRVCLSPHYFAVYGGAYGESQSRLATVVAANPLKDWASILFDGSDRPVGYHKSFLEPADAIDSDVCEIDLTNAPVLRQILGITTA